MPVSKALRFEILRRDGHRCTYCGAEAPDAKLHIDHIIPESLGGTNKPSNLTTACQQCNSGKAGRMIDETTTEKVDERAIRWASAMRQAIEENRRSKERVARISRGFKLEWENWTPRRDLPDDYGESVARFMEFGLDQSTIIELIEVAMRSPATDKFRYFCGCCHRRLDDLRARALEIVEEESSA